MAAIKKGLIFLGAAALLAGWLLPLRLGQYLAAPRPGPVRVEVAPGVGPGALARELAAAGLGSWEWGIRWGHRLWGRPQDVKAGTYAFPAPVRLRDVLSDLEAGRVEQVEVAIPEGLTVREMGRLLEFAGVTGAEALVRLALDEGSPSRWGLPGPTLEGYLFPDTYRFARGVEASRVVDAMVRRFRAVTDALGPEAEARGVDLHRWVTLASVVEKETGAAPERPLVAAVFHNRLQRGMRLQSDPTVIYGVDSFDGDLRRADLLRDTPYNTYTRAGLPRGPIANPGRASLEAVLRPAAVPYLYFVSRNDGTHVFTVSYDEHRRAVDRYQRRATP